MPSSKYSSLHHVLIRASSEGDQSPSLSHLTTECLTPLKRKLLKLEDKIMRTKKKIRKMEKVQEVTKIAQSSWTTKIPKKTLSQRITNPTLLQRMTSHCSKSNKNLNLTSQISQICPSLEGRRNSLSHFKRPTLFSRIGLMTPNVSNENGLSRHPSQSSLSLSFTTSSKEELSTLTLSFQDGTQMNQNMTMKKNSESLNSRSEENLSLLNLCEAPKTSLLMQCDSLSRIRSMNSMTMETTFIRSLPKMLQSITHTLSPLIKQSENVSAGGETYSSPTSTFSQTSMKVISPSLVAAPMRKETQVVQSAEEALTTARDGI